MERARLIVSENLQNERVEERDTKARHKANEKLTSGSYQEMTDGLSLGKSLLLAHDMNEFPLRDPGSGIGRR